MASGTVIHGPRSLFPAKPIEIDRIPTISDDSASSPKSPLERRCSLVPAVSFDQSELSFDLASPASEGVESTWHFRSSSNIFQPSSETAIPAQAQEAAHHGAPPSHSPSPSFAANLFSAASRTVRELLSGEPASIFVGADTTTSPRLTAAASNLSPLTTREAVAGAVETGNSSSGGKPPTERGSAQRASTGRRASQTAGSWRFERGSAEPGSETAAGKPATVPEGAAIRQRSLRWSAGTVQQRRGEARVVGGGIHANGESNGHEKGNICDREERIMVTATRATATRRCEDAGAGGNQIDDCHRKADGCDTNEGRDGSSTDAVSARRQERPRHYRKQAACNRSTRPRGSCYASSWDACHSDAKHRDGGSSADEFPCTYTSARRHSSAASSSVLLKPYEDIASRFVVHHREFGSGQYGSVRKCLEIETARVYACKTIKKNQIKVSEAADDIRREVASMFLARGHPHIVTLHDTIEDRRPTCLSSTPPPTYFQAVHLVMELCRGGDLFDRITKLGPYSEPSGAKLCQALTHAALSCHLHGIVHRDIKPENILLVDVSDDTNIKLADFGAAAFVTEGEMITDVAGTPEYMAPEMWGAVFDDSNQLISTPREHKVEYGSAVDVWSMGVVMYVAMSGVPPFWATAERTVAEAVLTRPVVFRPTKWGGVSEECKELITRMLEKDWRKRITPVEILEHPWIRKQVHRH
ncbi:unnamed protein product [Closterium sp. NIES-53]